MMKKWKKLIVLLICLLVAFAPAMSLSVPAQAASSAVKNGLKKENGKYYYYVNGKKAANTWKSVKAANGKTYRYYFAKDGAAYMGTKSAPLLKKIGSKFYAFNYMGRMITSAWKNLKAGNGKTYRYYLGSDGAAYMGQKSGSAMVPAIKKIGGKTYAFDANARMLKGAYVKDKVFYYFNKSNGVYNATITKKLRAAARVNMPAAALKNLLASYGFKPSKEEVQGESCFGNGKDVLWTYQNFLISVFRPVKGQDVVEGLAAR